MLVDRSIRARKITKRRCKSQPELVRGGKIKQLLRYLALLRILVRSPSHTIMLYLATTTTPKAANTTEGANPQLSPRNPNEGMRKLRIVEAEDVVVHAAGAQAMWVFSSVGTL